MLDESLLPKIHFQIGFTCVDNYEYYPDMACGKVDSFGTRTLVIEETNCYSCLDVLVKLGKDAAERLTELPPRVS